MKTKSLIAALFFVPSLISPLHGNISDLTLNPLKRKEILEVGDSMPLTKGIYNNEDSIGDFRFVYYTKDGEKIMSEIYRNCFSRPFAIHDLEKKVIYEDYHDKKNCEIPDGIIDNIIDLEKVSDWELKCPACPEKRKY